MVEVLLKHAYLALTFSKYEMHPCQELEKFSNSEVGTMSLTSLQLSATIYINYKKKATNEMTVYLPDYSIYSNKLLIVDGSNALLCYSEMLNKEHTGHVFAFQVPESHHILFIYLTSLRFGRHYVQLLGRFENIPERRTDKKR